MHYHMELVMPPVKDIVRDKFIIDRIMEPFEEEHEEDSVESSGHPFFDWYVIGGRWAGDKLLQSLDKDKLDQFEKWMQDEGITVSGLIFGKQELKPSDQINRVDAKWNEMFPRDDGEKVACPMFKHSNDQYGKDGDGTLDGDICNLKDAMHVRCERVMIAVPDLILWSGEWSGDLKAGYMISKDMWNGVNHVDTLWDGKLATAIEEYKKGLESGNPKRKEACEPKDNWLAITIDYHT